jgi:hypothetical protein
VEALARDHLRHLEETVARLVRGEVQASGSEYGDTGLDEDEIDLLMADLDDID